MKADLPRQEVLLGLLSRIDCGPVDAEGINWPRLFRRSLRERTAGIVAACAERLGLRLPEGVKEKFRAVRARLLAVQVLRARDREDALRALKEIPAVPFKGLDLAERAYRVPGVRDMADLDLLVPRDRFEEACARLAAKGWRPPMGAARALEAASGRTVNSLLLVNGERSPVHLHRHFAKASLPLPYARLPMEEVFARTRGGLLDAEATFLVLCEHAMKHSYSSLVHLSDVAAAWSGLTPDPAGTRRLARRWGLERPVRYASILARALLDAPIDGALADPRGLGAEGRIFLRSVLSGRRFDGLSTLGFLSMHEGWRAKWAFVRGAFSPAEGDMEVFGKPPRSRVARRISRAVAMVAKGLRG